VAGAADPPGEPEFYVRLRARLERDMARAHAEQQERAARAGEEEAERRRAADVRTHLA
jgi:hypothetical protein